MTKILIFIILGIVISVVISKKELFNYIDSKLIANVPIEYSELKNASIVPGTSKKAFLFDNETSYIQTQKTELNNNFTLSFFLKLNNLEKKVSLLHSKNNYIHLILEKDVLVLNITFDNLSYIVTHPFKLYINKWYHVCLVVNNKEVNIYLNGYLVKLNNKKQIMVDELRFGNNYMLNGNIDGYLGNIDIFPFDMDKNAICNNYKKCDINSKELKPKIEEILLDTSLDQDNEFCSFKPRGQTLLACKDRCQNIYDQHMWGGDKCTPLKCAEICDNCEDANDCVWLRDKLPENNLPEKPIIRGFSMNNKLKLVWGNPPTKNLINTYAIFINDLNKLYNNTTKINYFDNPNCMMCEYIINNLKNDNLYEIYIKAKNKYGYSEKSNKIIISPKKQLVIDKEILPSPDDSIMSDQKINFDDNVINSNEIESYLYNTDGKISKSNNNLSNNDYNYLAKIIFDKKFNFNKETKINLDIK